MPSIGRPWRQNLTTRKRTTISASPWSARASSTRPISHFRKALELDPDSVATAFQLASALGKHGQIQEAIARYCKVLELAPDFAEAHYNLATALASQGKPNEALAHYQKALALATARNDNAMADLIRARIKRIN